MNRMVMLYTVGKFDLESHNYIPFSISGSIDVMASSLIDVSVTDVYSISSV